MASFDPSVISQIADSAPNPAQAKQEAYTLASQMDSQTLHHMQLKDAQQTQADEAKAKQIVKTSNNATAQDRLATAEKLRKEVGPEYSNRFMKEAQGVESGDYAVQLQKMEVLSKQQESIVGAMDSVIGQVETYKQNNPGITEAELDAKTQQIGTAAMRSLAQQRPDLVPAIAQFAATPGAAKYQGWKSAEAASKEGRDRMNARLAQHKADNQDREQKDRDKAQLTRDRMADIAQQRADTAEKKRADDQTAKDEGRLEDAEAKDMARQYIAGDKSVMVGVGRGKQGAANIVKLRKFIRLESEDQGLSPVDRAARMAAFTGLMAEEQAAGRRQATIAIAAKESEKVFPIVEAAAKQVGRGNWVPINNIIQKLDTMRSDPKLGAFAQAIDTTVNVYARAIAPTGVPHEAARARALQILSTATSEADFEAKIDIMKQEIQAAVESPDEVREMILKSFKDSVKPVPGSPAAARAAQGAPAAGAPPANTTPPPGSYSHLWEKPPQ